MPGRHAPIVPPKPAPPPLLVAQKMEAVILYGYTAIKDFPRAERHVLSQEIRLAMWSILGELIQASKLPRPANTAGGNPDLENLLRRLDGDIELLRRQLRLAMGLTFLPFKRYEVWLRQLNEVGAIVGSWRLKLPVGQALSGRLAAPA
jgi:hypothetical protein